MAHDPQRRPRLRTRPIQLVAAVLVLSAITCSPAPAPEADGTVALRIAEGNRGATLPLAPVFIGDDGPLWFVIDTGAAESLIDRELAEHLGLSVIPGSERRIAGIAEAEAVEVIVESWRVGEVVLPPRPLASLALPEPPGSPVAGLLGSDILSTFGSVTVDYANEELRIAEAED